MAFQIGDHAGDYEIIGVLGSGGMGKVYKVRNQLSNRIEAMKVLLPNLTENPELADRFLREIRVQATLDHPNIAALHTAQRLDNQVLMLMEFVEGSPLDDLLKAGRIPLDTALDYAAQALDALDYAHNHGVIHRDVKPANMIVTPSGLLKLMDFGIAKLAADRKLTRTGSTMGSLYYMSPEQIQGVDVLDGRSDLYSLGICLYEITTGKRPFDANSEFGLMAAHLNEPPRPPIELDPGLPAMLNDIILISMAKDPAKRFQTAAAMRSAVNSVRDVSNATATILRPSPAAAAPPPPWTPLPSSEPAKSGRRGLYMTIGSLVTVGVLVAAVILIPKYLGTGAAGNAPSPQMQSQPQRDVPAMPNPEQTRTTAQEGPPVRIPEPAAPVPERQTKSPDHTATVERQTPLPVRRAEPPPTPEKQSEKGAAPQQPERDAPVIKSQESKAALNEAREQYNQLAIRANTAKSGLQSLQNQMGGLGLRADMREAATRMDFLMQEAMNAIRSGDVETARRNMDLADRTIEKIEKFLGR